MDYHSRLQSARDAETLAILTLSQSGNKEVIQKKFNELLKMV